ncbi:unnamed protein product [Somion occarium]|uniref:Uncharacterized protein n=1 Tax=Somion occarium TaxID=3059160 RepID=A0ABP1CVL8_9APHY
MPSLHQTEVHSASRLHGEEPAPLTERGKDASTTTAAASASTPVMVPQSVPTSLDPRNVTTPIQVDKVEALLQELGIAEDWRHVLEGLRNGFDVGVKDTPPRSFMFKNHASASLDEEFIDSYIAGEQAAGRYSQGFAPDDLEGIIGFFRTSPLGLVPKPHSDHLRMVQDISYPRNNVCHKSP